MQMPDMNINISVDDFHSIRNKASDARELVEKGMEKLTIKDLRDVLRALTAGQRLSNAETGSDSMFAPNYREDIDRVQNELKRRDEDVLQKTNEIAGKHNLSAEILPEALSVGVQGDNRTYLPVIVLKGEFPGWDILRQVSTEITNTVNVNRVTYDSTP